MRLGPLLLLYERSAIVAIHADAQQAQAVQRCTRYDSNALDRRALH